MFVQLPNIFQHMHIRVQISFNYLPDIQKFVLFITKERNYFINIFLLDRKWIARAYVCVFFLLLINIHECINDK